MRENKRWYKCKGAIGFLMLVVPLSIVAAVCLISLPIMLGMAIYELAGTIGAVLFVGILLYIGIAIDLFITGD